jgi:hypothetical protein
MSIRGEKSGGELPVVAALATIASLSIALHLNKDQSTDSHDDTHKNETVLDISEVRKASFIRPYVTYNHPPNTITATKHHHHKAPTPAQIAAKEVTPEEFKEWSKVNECEEGGDWHVSGSTYSGGLGISNANWVSFGGQFFSPTGANATPDEQIVVAMRIQKDPPDQYGCGGGW